MYNLYSRFCPCLRIRLCQSFATQEYSTAKQDEPFSEIIPEPKYEWSNTIPFIPPITSGHVIKVYDGDTITLASSLPYPDSPMYRFSVRLNGIDTPEMHGINEDEKQAAKNSQKALENLILHHDIILKNIQTEKYGRILADVYLGDLHINNWMLQNKFAIQYDGGTKIHPKSWIRFQSTGNLN
jgi:endonuclease YncB( thermonuclease family)